MATKTLAAENARMRREITALSGKVKKLEGAVLQLQQDVARLASRDHIERNALVNAGLVAPSLIDAPVELPHGALVN